MAGRVRGKKARDRHGGERDKRDDRREKECEISGGGEETKI